MICISCGHPIPSWQHEGACKPVAEKVPLSLRIANKAADIGEAIMRVTENPPALPKRRGRPKKDDSLSPAQKQAAYRRRKQG